MVSKLIVGIVALLSLLLIWVLLVGETVTGEVVTIIEVNESNSTVKVANEDGTYKLINVNRELLSSLELNEKYFFEHKESLLRNPYATNIVKIE